MAQQVINIGAVANDGTGDPVRVAFTKCNANFSELFGKSAAGSNLDITANEIAAINSNGNVELVPNGAGKVVVVDDTITINTSKTPLTSVGAPGDTAGMIAWNSSYIYVCTSNYDGSTAIWKRAAIGGSW